MTITRASTKRKLSKRDSYIGNYYVRPRRYASLKKSSWSDSLSDSNSSSSPNNTSTEDFFRLSSDSFDSSTRSTNNNEPPTTPPQLMHTEDIPSRTVTTFNLNSEYYVRSGEKAVTSEYRSSRGEVGPQQRSSRTGGKPIAITMISFGNDSLDAKKPLRKNLSLETTTTHHHRRKANLKKKQSFDDFSDEQEFQIVFDTSTF